MITKEQALKSISNNMAMFFDALALLQGEPTVMFDGLKVDKIVDYDAAVTGAATMAMMPEFGAEIVISVDDLYFVGEYMKLTHSVHKLAEKGLCGLSDVKDEYGFPCITMNAEQIKKGKDNGWAK